MPEDEKRLPPFSASKRRFLKKMALFGVYVGPLIRSFEMAEITAKATGPVKKKKVPTMGGARLRGSSPGSGLA